MAKKTLNYVLKRVVFGLRGRFFGCTTVAASWDRDNNPALICSTFFFGDMMSFPSISVVLPVYNGEDLIEQALGSILAQDLPLELVVSDDRSSDRTMEKIRSFSGFENIKILTNEKNAGIFGNLNRAIKAASCDLIQIFSQDDVMRKGFLASQIAALARAPNTGLVYSNYNIIDESGTCIGANNDQGTPGIIDLPTYLDISSKWGSLPGSISCVMLPRRTFESVGFFDERFSVAGDLEFYNRVAEQYLIARNLALLVDIRAHPGSTTSARSTHLKYIKEEALLLPFYERHLGPEKYAGMLKFRAKVRGADHAKYLLRLASRLEFRELAVGWSELAKVHNVPACIFYALRDKAMPSYRKSF